MRRTNDVIGRGDMVSGCIAQGRVGAARNVALGRLITHGRVKAAAGVAEERIKTISRVVVAGGIMQERVRTGLEEAKHPAGEMPSA